MSSALERFTANYSGIEPQMNADERGSRSFPSVFIRVHPRGSKLHADRDRHPMNSVARERCRWKTRAKL
jgi:hypothetical protein